MSDRSSVPLPSSTHKTPGTEVHLVNPNTILQKALQQLGPEERSAIVLRCDDLPFLPGSEPEWQQIFSHLLNMILSRKADVSKLYLHIHCSTTGNKESGSATDKSVNQVTIQFCTNIIPPVEWLQANQLHINEVAATLHKYEGSLIVNHLKNPGCIFSVTLPGKQQ